MAPKKPVSASNSGVVPTAPGPPVTAPSDRARTPEPASTKSTSTSATTTTTTSTSSATTKQNVRTANPNASPAEIVSTLWDKYQTTTPQRTKLIDLFLVFLVGVAGVQFVYCILAGNYPFNAFLAGFSATVGQFVLTASLRIQSNPANKNEFTAVSPERAFADFVFGSLILHFFCVNFIN